jgi:hypothetical protein
MPAGETGRLGLAHWLVSPQHPLTSRVAVNRIWQEVFGRGIVFTSEDFGTQGDRPTHPELLDWLGLRIHAARLEHETDGPSSGDIFHLPPKLQRAPRTRGEGSRKYTACPPVAPAPARGVDPRRTLYAAGLLDLRIGGRSVKPPQPKGVAELSYAGSVKWEESTGPDRYRRGLYIHFQRTVPYPQLISFDAPSASLACPRRERTDTPLQALNLMNDPVFFEAAQGTRLPHHARDRRRKLPRPSQPRLRDHARAVSLQPAKPERMGKYFDDTSRGLAARPQTVAALFPNQLEGVPQSDAAAWVETEPRAPQPGRIHH